MNVFIGIDPSINSTGMTIRTDTGYCRFFIIKGDKLTKKEKNAQLDNSEIFEYCLYFFITFLNISIYLSSLSQIGKKHYTNKLYKQESNSSTHVISNK